MQPVLARDSQHLFCPPAQRAVDPDQSECSEDRDVEDGAPFRKKRNRNLHELLSGKEEQQERHRDAGSTDGPDQHGGENA